MDAKGYYMSSTAGSGGVTSGLVLDLDGSYIGLTATVDVLLVAGGGGGGMDMGGGGGAGGVLYTTSSIAHGNTYAVVVGAGGAGARARDVASERGANGTNSTFNGLTAIGGGGGASFHDNSSYPAGSGGSGGGASGGAQAPSGGSAGAGGYGGGAAGTGTAGQGYAGSFGIWAWYPGGGGGAGGVGSTNPANGGPGICYPTMSPYYFGGGGGGSAHSVQQGGAGGIGGGGGGALGDTGVAGKGGQGGGSALNAGVNGSRGPNNAWANVPGGSAGANTGGGGGGGSHYNSNNAGGAGGSGIVIIRYLGRQRATGGVVSSLNGYTIHTFLTDGTFSTAAWVDKSGNGNTGTFVNGPTYSSAGGALVTDGIDDYCLISVFTNKPTTMITCESWIKPTKSTITGTIRGASISSSNSMYLGIIDSIDGGVTFALHWANQTSSRPYSWHGNVPNNAWSHIVGTYDGTTSCAYINGVQVWEAAQTGTIPDATYYVGTYGPTVVDGVHNFKGELPLNRIYNRALSVAEVRQNFNASRARFGI